MSSDTSSNNNSSYHKSTVANKKTTFTTDYMPDYLADPDKLVEEEKRVNYVRQTSDNGSDDSDINNYVSDKHKSENNTRHYSESANNNSNNHSNANTNIFQKSIQHDQYKFDNKNPDEKKDLP